MGARRAIGRSFSRYAEFTGRAPRAEFWWFLAFWQLAAALFFGFGDDGVTLAALALLVPAISSGARRLHDIGRSGWWLLLAVTWVGLVPLVWWLASPGDPEGNRFGPPDPLARRR